MSARHRALNGFPRLTARADGREAVLDTVTDDALAGRLSVAIQGTGAFRRFKDTLFPNEEWWGRWLTFSSERQLGRARWWLADAGLRPAPEADRSASD